MINWRAPLAFLLLAVALGLTALPAGAQPSAPQPGPESKAGPEAELESQLDSRPQSPEDEAALRRARLDALFARLARNDSPDWLSVQNEIWAQWSQSGSPAMDLLLRRAESAMENGRFELALRFLDDLVRLAPDFAEGWNKRATVYFLLEEYGRSVADIARTLALEQRHFGALSGLGMILERLGDKKGAMRAYRRGLEVHPNLPGAAQGVERLSPDVDGRAL
ncbi:MAG: tetratricopeptide repeat protein [Proteobacteria bacterium]|nr:tetratricopeptide repeat protein [Pseudomonadota bacterium]